MTQHAAFPPSSICRVIQCPGSWHMCQLYPGEGNEEAAAGDAAHWVVATDSNVSVGTIAPNGVAITEEMLEGADIWAEGIEPGGHIEQTLPPSEMIDPDNWGTPDWWIHKSAQLPGGVTGFHIRVRDYKFGHRHVEVHKNWQLMNYAFLILDHLHIDGMSEQFTRIDFDIVQPRSYHHDGPVRTWSCMASDLRAARNLLKAAIDAARKTDAICTTGPECRDCPARAHCPALQQAALGAIEESHRPAPLVLPAPALGTELRLINRAIDRLKARATGLEEVARSMIATGAVVNGYAMQRGEGRQKWTAPIDQIVALEDLMGVTITKRVPITPAQAIKAGLDAAVVNSMSDRTHGELKLVEDDGSAARQAFG